MKNKSFWVLAIGALVLTSAGARAHDDEEDQITQIDRYHHADVIHYDHHHRYVYTDEFGNVIGDRTVHHDHHYVQPPLSSSSPSLLVESRILSRNPSVRLMLTLAVCSEVFIRPLR